MPIKIPLYKVPQDRFSVVFTWDDNSYRHFSEISPLFIENGFRCTFYIVPGEEEFDSKYASQYAELSKYGFEIGSHSYSHKYMTSLSIEDSEHEFSASILKILEILKIYPLTYAFPHHNFNKELIDLAYNYHLETRNTLNNAVRFSIKTETPLIEMITAIDKAIFDNSNLVFSGHSIIMEDEYLNKKPGEGYEPMRISILLKLLQYLKTKTSKINVTTFSQSALREWIKKSASLKKTNWLIYEEELRHLGKLFITKENIVSKL